MTSKSRHMIRGTTVYLRGLEQVDAALYARWRSDAGPMNMSGFAFRGPLTQVGADATIAAAHETQGKPDWRFIVCLVKDDRPIGEVFLMDVDKENRSASFGMFIGDPADWGQGYGSDALNAVCDFGFGRLDLARIELLTRADNANGRRSYEKSGFILEGTKRSAVYTHGRRSDLLVMGLLREEWEKIDRPRSWEISTD